MKTINIAKDFSVFPGGRFKEDNEYSAEEFRDTILIPCINKYNKIIIELDGLHETRAHDLLLDLDKILHHELIKHAHSIIRKHLKENRSAYGR